LKKILSVLLLFLLFYTSINAETKKEIFDSGVQLFKQGDYQKAIDRFTDLITISPNNADAYKNRGVSYMKVDQFDLAIKDFEKAKDIFPELKGLYSNLGVAWYYKKDYEKAIENYNIEIQMAPENSVAYFNRALCLSELNKNKEALDDLTRTLEIKPDFYWAICYKGDLLAKQGNTEEAIKAYKEAISQNVEDTYATEKLSRLQGNKMVSPKKETAVQKGTYSLQAGAFLNLNNAKKMKKNLAAKGFDSDILVLKDSKDRTWHLVRSGTYKTETEANNARSILNQKMKLKSVVRPSDSW